MRGGPQTSSVTFSASGGHAPDLIKCHVCPAGGQHPELVVAVLIQTVDRSREASRMMSTRSDMSVDLENNRKSLTLGVSNVFREKGTI